MNSPYELKLISHLSASAIRDYMSCEVRGAYARNFIRVPKVAKPVSMMAGVMYHALMEKFTKLLWKKIQASPHRRIGEDDHKNFVRFGFVVMRDMLDGKIGSRGPGSTPEAFYWPFDSRREELGEKSYQEKISEKKSHYAGMTSLVLEALRQQYTEPPKYRNVMLEQSIKHKKSLLSDSLGEWQFPVHGSIDLIEDYGEAGLAVIDYKSGWITQKYKDRINLIEDIQMTLYSYAVERIYGKIPAALYIQPLEFSHDFLDTHGPDTLRQLRIELPPRESKAHFTGLMNLAEDLNEMVNRIVRPKRYSITELNEWEPKSDFAKKAGFRESVKEGRFKPRVGPWCNTCQYVTLCSKDHPSDWDNKGFAAQQAVQEAPKLPEQQLVEVTQDFSQGQLFGEPKKTSAYVRKADKEIRSEMVATNLFLTKAKVMPTLNKIANMMKSQGVCQCTRLNLFPIWLLSSLADLLDQTKPLTINQVCEHCPYEDCARKKTADI